MTVQARAVDTKAAVLAFNQGAVAMAEGQEESAIGLWRKALELDPGLIPAALNLVTYYQDHDDHESELALWERITQFDPFETDHLIMQAAAFRKGKKLREAVDSYRRAISIYPYFKFWYHELARVYEELGEKQEASLWRDRGDTLGADEAEICYEDGLRHAVDQRWPSARTCFEAVLDEFPANLDARLRLAKVLENAGTHEEVMSQYRLALELTEAAKGLVYYRMGEYLARRGSVAEAREAFTRALENVPRYIKASRAIAGIDAQTLQSERRAAASEAAASEAEAEAEATEAAAELLPEEPAAVQVHDVEMEPVRDAPPHRTGHRFWAPNPRLPWQQQLRQVLDQVLLVASPGGREPRVALVLEADEELALPVNFIFSELRSLGRSLRADAEESHIYVVEDGPDPSNNRDRTVGGWLGRDPVPQLQTSRWGRGRPGVDLYSALYQVGESAGSVGFNCLLVVAFGRGRSSAEEVAAAAAGLPVHAACFLHPRYHYIDTRLALANQLPNYMEIAF